MRIIPREVTQFVTNGTQPGSARTGAHALTLSRATNAIAARCGNVVCRAWPGDRDSQAPYFTMSSVQTWTDISTGSGSSAVPAASALIPFMLTPGLTDIAAIVRVLCAERVNLSVRLKCQAFPGDTYTTQYSEATTPQLPTVPTAWGKWSKALGTVFWGLEARMRVVTSSPDSSGRLLVAPQVLVGQDRCSAFENGDTIDAHLESIIVADSLGVSD